MATNAVVPDAPVSTTPDAPAAPVQSNVDKALDQFRAPEAAQPAAQNPPTAITPETPADPNAAPDPLEAVKDNPRVIELLATEEQHKAFQEVVSNNKYVVSSPEELGQQLGDAALLYDIVSGKVPATAILDVMMNNQHWTPEQKQSVFSQLAEYITQKTGKPVAAAAAGFTDPIQQKLADIEGKLTAKEQAEQQQKQQVEQERINKSYQGKIDELCKDFKDDAGYYSQMVAQKFAGNAGILAQVAKGNFAQVVKAFHEVRNEDVKRFERWSKSLVDKKQADKAGLPVSPNGTPVATQANAQTVFKSEEERKEFALRQFQGK
jgi:hypothetical protein